MQDYVAVYLLLSSSITNSFKDIHVFSCHQIYVTTISEYTSFFSLFVCGEGNH